MVAPTGFILIIDYNLMSWVTFVWALVIGACVTMALPHLLIGIKRRAWENLFFALAALSVAAIACGELAIMHSRTTEQIGRDLQLIHVPMFFLVVGDCGIRSLLFWDRTALAGDERVCGAVC